MLRQRRFPFAAVVALFAASPAGAAIGETGAVTFGTFPTVGGARGAPAMSADGRFVAFTSTSAFSGTPTLGRTQLFVRDRLLGTIVLASADEKGIPGAGDVDDDPNLARYSLSADGHYVAFASAGPNLVDVDTNGAARDVFRKDLITGRVVLVNRGPLGAQTSTEVLGQPDISADGNRVAFVSGKATDLLAADQNGETSDVVVRDIRAARTILVSRSDGGLASAGFVGHPAISGDGTTIAFEASPAAANLVLGDTNGRSDVVVRDLRASSTRLASVAADGTRPGGAYLDDLSGDGREVVFESESSFDATVDANGTSEVYFARPFAGVPGTVLVSRRRVDGRAPNGASVGATISSDASRIAFVSTATDIDPGDPNGSVADGYVASVNGVALRETGRLDGSTPSRPVGPVVLAGSGAALAFAYDDASPSEPFLTGDSNGVSDIFVRERARLDVAGPTIDVIAPADGSTVSTSRAFLAATVNDPSGVASVTVNGRPVTVTVDGAVAARVAIAAEAALTIQATDSNGNRSERVVRVRRAAETHPAYGIADPLPAPTTEVTGVHATRDGRRRVSVGFSLSGGAVVRVRLLRRITPAGGQVGWHPVTTWTRAVLDRGRQRLRIATPVLVRGVYQVRVLALAGGVRQGASLLVLRASSTR